MPLELANEISAQNPAEKLDSATANFRNFGNFPCAGQTLQRGISHFRLDESGYLAYQRLGRNALVIGDPVIARDRYEEILSAFLRVFPFSCFVQCSEKTGLILKSRGYHITPVGIETHLPLPYKLCGKDRSDIRHLANRARAAGLKVRELEIPDKNNDWHNSTFAGISKRTIRFPGELRFLAVGGLSAEVDGARLFAGFDKNGIAGISLFYPMFQGGKITGYSEVVPRRSLSAPKGTRVGILLGAISQFETEGIGAVSLGLSPFFKVKELSGGHKFCDCNESSKLFEMIYKYDNISFNYRGLAFHKSRFKGIEKAAYFASKKKLPFVELIKIYRLTTGRWLPSLLKRNHIPKTTADCAS